MITTLPRSVAESSELVRVHIHPDDLASKTRFTEALRHELEPCIVGVREIIVHEIAEGVVIMSRHARE